MIISVSSYSFSQYINAGKLDLLSAVDKAHEMGFEAMEFIDIPGGTFEERKKLAEDIYNKLCSYNMTVTAYTVGGEMFLEEEDFQRQFEATKKELEIAKILHAPLMRHDASFQMPGIGKKAKSFDLMLPTIAKNIRTITEYAETLGIKTCIENHGFTVQDPDRVERLYNAVNHDNFGLLVDMGNFLCADADPAMAVSKVAPYAIHAHAKDMVFYPGTGSCPGPSIVTRAGNWLRCTIIGQGSVPIKQCLRVLKKAGYQGALGIEFEGCEDCIESIAIGYNNLKKYLAELDNE